MRRMWRDVPTSIQAKSGRIPKQKEIYYDGGTGGKGKGKGKGRERRRSSQRTT